MVRGVSPVGRRFTLVVLAASMLFASTAAAWDDFGHMEVAAVAFKTLNTKAKAKVAALLKLNRHCSG